MRHRDLATLSDGEQKRSALEVLLRGGDEVLLLDEPAGNLNVDIAEALENALAGFDGAVYEPDEPVWTERRPVRRAH